MRLSIRHITSYAYAPPADRCALRLKLYPSQFDGQQVMNWKVSVNGTPVAPLLTTGVGDRESIWTANRSVADVEIVAEGEVETHDAAGVVRGLRDTMRPSVFMRTTPLTAPDPAIEALAASAKAPAVIDQLHGLCSAVRDAVDYQTGSTDSRTPAALALKRGTGVCQDHAHIFISAARSLGAPARYIVGYLLAEGTALTETHAWAEAFTSDLGWVGFDPTNRICPTERYVRLACGLDSADAAPIRGAVSTQGAESLVASVAINQSQQTQNQQ
ncbi:MAG: transglutaminase family protein [Alphaproteobacteria bacterium]